MIIAPKSWSVNTLSAPGIDEAIEVTGVRRKKFLLSDTVIVRCVEGCMRRGSIPRSCPFQTFPALLSSSFPLPDSMAANMALQLHLSFPISGVSVCVNGALTTCFGKLIDTCDGRCRNSHFLAEMTYRIAVILLFMYVRIARQSSVDGLDFGSHISQCEIGHGFPDVRYNAGN